MEIQLKKTRFSAFLLELKKLLRFHLLSRPSTKARATDKIPRFRHIDPLPELKIRQRRFIPMSVYHSLAMHGKIDVAYRVLELIESNPLAFACPEPSMVAFKSVIDELGDAYTDYQHGGRGHYYHAMMMKKEQEFLLIFKDVIEYVEYVTGGQIEAYNKVVIGHIE